MRLQAGLKAWTQVLHGQIEDKADVDMDTEAPQVGHKPGGEPKIKVNIDAEKVFLHFFFYSYMLIHLNFGEMLYTLTQLTHNYLYLCF